MKHFSRLVWTILVVICAGVATGAEQGFAQPVAAVNANNPNAYLAHGSPGYLGIDIHDIDSDRATALKLKDTHGAEIVTIDHDAPANKAGLKLHDVVLEMNGQHIDDSEQLRHMLNETPSGRTVHFVISRDGQPQNISVELGDRAQIEAKAWKQHFTVPDPDDQASQGFVAPSSHGFGNGFFGVFLPSSLYIGADVDAISTQLASYFGVSDGTGLLVRSVDENSPAAAAGLKAGDIITRVNNNPMTSRADWLKTMHANRGKQVQVVVMRNKKEQTLSMQAGEPKKKSKLEQPQTLSGLN
jgi:S1-C subfamily serine protease